MRITSLDAFPICLPRDLAAAKGTAGSPTTLSGDGRYRWSTAYPVLYSTNFETALIRVRLENGLEGWGEAQAPLAPEVACSIVEHLLRPAIVNEEFDGSIARIEELWSRMYATMRVRGQTGGFMLDAISGVDLALWDLAGKLAGKPVSALLTDSAKQRLRAYLSGTHLAKSHADAGFDLIKLYYESDWSALLEVADALPAHISFAVDALWHLPPAAAVEMARELDSRNARWLECPLYPEDINGHVALSEAISTPIAIGESYRTRAEIKPFAEVAGVLQPDLGRSGITESMAIAREFGKEIVPHVSIAMGPQLAAALHFAAACEHCRLCEYNPNVVDTANAFLASKIVLRDGHYEVPAEPGLGIVWNDRLAELLGGK